MIAKRKKFIKWFVLLTPLIDGINGISAYLGVTMKFSFGQIIRIILLVILFLLLSRLSSKKALMILLLVSTQIVKDLIMSTIYGASLFASISYDIRYIYVLIVVMLFEACCQKRVIQYQEMLTWAKYSALTISIIILGSRILNVGLTYAGSSKGIFIEVNSLTALLVWSSSIWLYQALVKKKTIITIICAILVTIATFSQGTKTGVIGITICFIYLCFYSGIVKHRWAKFIVIAFLGCIGGYLIWFYFQTGIGAKTLARWTYFFNNTDIITFLLSGRNQALRLSFNIWRKNAFYIIFGTTFSKGVQMVYSINPSLSFGGPEMDIFDIFYYYGLIIGGIVTFYILRAVIISIKNILKRKNAYYSFSFIMLVTISFFGGHVLNSPMAGVFFAISYTSIFYLEDIYGKDYYPDKLFREI